MATRVEQEHSAVPHVQAPIGALGSACPLFQPGFVQELGMPNQKGTGTPAHEELLGRDEESGQSTAPSPGPWYLGAECGYFSFHASVEGTAGRHQKLQTHY